MLHRFVVVVEGPSPVRSVPDSSQRREPRCA
jgi:hypothetical protein